MEFEDDLDWIIICLKAHQYEAAGLLFKNLIGKNTKIATIRNGINLVEDMTPFTDLNSILPCMIDCPVQPKAQNVYWQLSRPTITTEVSPLANEFATLFASSDISIHQVDDFKTEIWKKLIESSSLGALLCITGQTCHILKNPKVLEIYISLINEGIEVAIADNAKLDYTFLDDLIAKVQKYPDDKGSSMLTDRLLGNKIELEAKNGAISKIAISYKIDTPINDMFCALISSL